MKIALLSPIAWRTPPRHYGPWENIAGLLAKGLSEIGEDVTLFATSDSRFFRQLGIPVYGICPVLFSLGDISMIHGIDEKISVENVIKGTEVYTKIMRRLCA